MYKILIVEDDLALCEELTILLEKSGYNVQSIKDFTDVYTEMMQSDADLILLDITLPGDDGEVLLQRYRKNKETPVIMHKH